MIDLTGISKEELRQLQRQIQIELTESYFIDKSLFVPEHELYCLVDNKVKALGGVDKYKVGEIADNDYRIGHIIPDDILEICDYALGNYEIRIRGKNKDCKSIMRKRYCDKTIVDRYQALANELSNIVLKYLRNEDVD